MAEIPARGDRSAWDSTNHPDKHAKDIEDDAPTVHVPAPVSDNQTVKSAGGVWTLDAFGGGAGYTEGARVYHDAAQTIASATSTTLAFNSERYDTNTIHDLVTNNSRLTCQTAGKYMIVANIEWAANATGYRSIILLLNGTTTIAGQTNIPGSGTYRISVSTIYDLAQGDYVEVKVYQSTTGNLNVNAAAAYSPEFMMQRIG